MDQCRVTCIVLDCHGKEGPNHVGKALDLPAGLQSVSDGIKEKEKETELNFFHSASGLS